MRLDERVEAEARRRPASAVPSLRRRGRAGAEARRRRRLPWRCGGARRSRRSPWRGVARSSPARAARRSSQVPPKRSSTSTEIAAAPAAAYAGAIRAGSASGRRSPADGERRLISAIAPSPGCASASLNRPIRAFPCPSARCCRRGEAHASPVVCRAAQAGDACASPLRQQPCSCFSPREGNERLETLRRRPRVDRRGTDTEPVAQVVGKPCSDERSRSVQQHRVTAPALLAREQRADRGGVLGGRAASQLVRIGGVDP